MFGLPIKVVKRQANKEWIKTRLKELNVVGNVIIVGH